MFPRWHFSPRVNLRRSRPAVPGRWSCTPWTNAPLQRRVFGGCHIDRPIDRLVAGAGLELTRMDNYYLKGPRAFGYMFDGVAAKPSGQ